jgi:hypothetical protein
MFILISMVLLAIFFLLVCNYSCLFSPLWFWTTLFTPTFWMYFVKALHMYYASFWSLVVSIVLKNKSLFGQISMMLNKRQLLMLSHPFEQIVAPYLWIELFILLITSLDKSSLEQFYPDCMVRWWFIKHFEWDVGLIEESCSLLVKILFGGWIHSLL